MVQIVFFLLSLVAARAQSPVVRSEQIDAAAPAAERLTLQRVTALTSRTLLARAALAEIEFNERVLRVLGEENRPIKLGLTHAVAELALLNWASSLSIRVERTLTVSEARVVRQQLVELVHEMNRPRWGLSPRVPNPNFDVVMSGTTVTHELSGTRLLLATGVVVAVVADAVATYKQIQLTPGQVDQQKEALRTLIAEGQRTLNDDVESNSNNAREASRPRLDR